MAKTLRTDSFYANLTCAIAVDDDNTTVKDFCGNQTVTLETGVAATNGSLGYACKTSTAGGEYTPRGIALSPGISIPDTSAGTTVLILNDLVAAGDQGHLVTEASSKTDFFGIRFTGTNENPGFYFGSTQEHNTSIQPKTAPTFIAWTWDYPNDVQTFYAQYTGGTFPVTPDYSGTRASAAENVVISRVGGSGLGSLDIEVFAYLQFSTVLTNTQLAEIYDSLTGSGNLSIFDSGTPSATITLSPDPTSVQVGSTREFTIARSTAAGVGGVTYNLASEDTDVATVPATVTITEVNTTATFNATGVSVGSANITATNAADSGETDTAALTVTAVTTKKAKFLVHPDFQGATGIVIEVNEAPTGGALTGAKLGFTTGVAAEATLESGKAVIKVNAADVGASGLAAATGVRAIFKGTTSASSPLGNAVEAGSVAAAAGTIIEE